LLEKEHAKAKRGNYRMFKTSRYSADHKSKKYEIYSGDVKNETWKYKVYILIAMFVALFTPFNDQAAASEGAWSSYTPGTYGDFAMNYAAPGLYFRENIIYVTGKVDNFPVAPTINANLEQTTWFNLLNITYISEKKFLGGHYFFNTAIPYGFSSAIEADVDTLGHHEDKTSGLGDIWIAPFGLMWHLGSFHIVLTENIVLQSGRYNAANLINMGRNYTSFDTNFGVTWLDEKRGHEISMLAGYMVNTKNQWTDYKTGEEFHIDFSLNQFLSEHLGFGVVGYYYKQVTDDSSPSLDSINQINSALGLSTPGGYKGESAGIGPALMWSPAKDFQIIAKWLHEYHAENRFKGDWGFLSACIKF